MIITGIEGGTGALYLVSFDEGKSLPITPETLLSEGLFAGMTLSPADYRRLEQASLAAKARERALYLLDRRPLSRQALYDKLKKTYPPALCEDVCDVLEGAGILDDRRYAALYAEELSSVKHYSRRRIAQELYEKGIAREISSEVLEELFAEDLEQTNLRALIERRYLRQLQASDGRKKVIGALQRQGYRFADIRAALDELTDGVEETDSGEPDPDEEL